MANLVVRAKIMPKEAEVTPARILEDLRQRDPSLEIRSSREEPIAFGVVALIADFLISDASGEMDRLENVLRSSNTVGEFEILGASRLSTQLK